MSWFIGWQQFQAAAAAAATGQLCSASRVATPAPPATPRGAGCRSRGLERAGARPAHACTPRTWSSPKWLQCSCEFRPPAPCRCQWASGWCLDLLARGAQRGPCLASDACLSCSYCRFLSIQRFCGPLVPAGGSLRLDPLSCANVLASDRAMHSSVWKNGVRTRPGGLYEGSPLVPAAPAVTGLAGGAPRMAAADYRGRTTGQRRQRCRDCAGEAHAA